MSDALPDATLAFLLGGLSIGLASRDPAGRPSLARGCGVRADAEPGLLRIVVVAPQACDLLASIEACGQVAAVFSEVDSHRTLQVKSGAARVVPADAADRLAVELYTERFSARLDPLGFPPDFVHAVLGHAGGELRTVRLRPDHWYSQTPGPSAGQPVGA